MATFRELTMRNFSEMETESFKNGGLTSFNLPETGLGARLYLTVAGTLSVALGTGSATVSVLGIMNQIARNTVRLNDGTILYEVEGFNSNIPAMLQNGYDPSVTDISRGYTALTPFNAPAAGSALATQDYQILYTIEIPFINNDKDMLGMILLQNGTTQAKCEIQWNRTTDTDGLNAPVKVVGNATASFVGTVVPTLEFYSLPSVPAEELKAMISPYLKWVNQWKSEYEALTSTATTKKKLERGSVYAKIAHRYIINSALSDTAPANFRLLMKGNENPVSIKKDLQLFLQRRNYGFDLPDGLFVHDQDRSYGIEEFGDTRDLIDSRQLTEFISETSYNSGSISGTSFIYTLVNKLTPVNM